MITLKKQLPARVKEERLAFAEKHINVSKEDLMRMVFIDEAKLPLAPRAQRVIAVKGEEVIEVDARAGRQNQESRPLEYILAVNPYIGIVHLSIISDKSDLKPGQAVHKVRAAASVFVFQGTTSFNWYASE